MPKHFVMSELDWLALCSKQCKARQKLGPSYYDKNDCTDGPCAECVEDAIERMPGKYLTTEEEAKKHEPLPGMGEGY